MFRKGQHWREISLVDFQGEYPPMYQRGASMDLAGLDC